MSNTENAGTLGKKASDHLRRLFLRQLARPAVYHLDAPLFSPDIFLFPGKQAFRAKPGEQEGASVSFYCPADSYDVQSITVCVVLATLPSSEGRSCQTLTITDGLVPLMPRVLDGTIETHLITSSQALLSDRKNANVVLAELVLDPKVDEVLAGCCQKLFSTSAFSADVVVNVPDVKSQPTGRLAFGKMSVNECPDEILEQVPIVRSKERDVRRNTTSEVLNWKTERRHLAEVAGGSALERDIEILGVFKRVPLSGAIKIQIGRGGSSLNVFVRANRRNMVQSPDRPLVTIAFGRLRGSQQVIRALIPE